MGTNFSLGSNPLPLTEMSDMNSSFGSSTTEYGYDASFFGDDSPLFTAEDLSFHDTSATVSPHDLALDSAPASAAMTNLTTPDMNANLSPFDNSYDTSPMFNADGDPSAMFGDDAGLSSGMLMFPPLPGAESTTAAAPPMQRNYSQTSMNEGSSSNSSPALNGSKKSERPTSMHRHSASAGVTKPRRRGGALKEIVIDPSDKQAAKRARNTLAARESRSRKQMHIEHMQSEIEKREDLLALMRVELAAHGYEGPLLEEPDL
jgi:general control protein GCN4